jgi:hypothetical protein
MSFIHKKEVPEDILQDSVLALIAAAYFSVGKNWNKRLGVPRLAASSSQRFEAAPRSIRIRSPRF